MFRVYVSAAIMAILLPSLALADKKASADGRTSESKVLPASLYGEARSGRCVASSASTPAGSADPGGLYPAWMSPHPTANHSNGYGAFGDELRHQLLWDQHECAPDGCIKPLGCGNLWTEIKFVFGSCRQFFGTAESTVGHHRNTRDRFATPYR